MKARAYKVKPMPFLEWLTAFHQQANSLPMPQHRDCSDDDLLPTITRASDPRPGDRFLGLDNATVIEVKSVFPMEEAGLGPGHDRCVEYTDTRHGEHLFNLFIWKFQELAKIAIQAGHTFHPVEDDEE